MNIDSIPATESWRLKTLSDIEPIEESAITPTSREHLDELVELPVREACKTLFDRGIKTMMSSANRNDFVYLGEVHIIIDFDKLTEENKKIAETIGVIDSNTSFFRTQTVKIEIPINDQMKVGEISDAMLKKVSVFEAQN